MSRWHYDEEPTYWHFWIDHGDSFDVRSFPLWIPHWAIRLIWRALNWKERL